MSEMMWTAINPKKEYKKKRQLQSSSIAKKSNKNLKSTPTRKSTVIDVSTTNLIKLVVYYHTIMVDIQLKSAHTFIVLGSLRKSFLFPTKMIGTFGQKCLTYLNQQHRRQQKQNKTKIISDQSLHSSLQKEKVLISDKNGGRGEKIEVTSADRAATTASTKCVYLGCPFFWYIF